MARALTSGELAYLRSDGQFSRLYLAIYSPSSVFTARVNGAPASDDKVYQVTYDGGSAGYADAIAGMTVWVGSEAGTYDKGMVRLRGTLSETFGTMKIGETSEIAWADNDYLTVVNEFALWPRHVFISGTGTVYMDREVAYSDQHADCDPTPVLGPHAVAWLTGASVDVDFDASDSWCQGSSVSAYSWSAPGSSGLSGGSTATPTVTYNAAGTYRVSCTITAANGKTYTGYRVVFVFDDDHSPVTTFRLNSCGADYDRGGWEFSITMWDEATLSEIRNRALVVLFARDWYGADEVSIGPVDDRENIIAMGWIGEESITYNPEQSSVSFRIYGPQWWLNRMPGFPSGIEDYDGTPTTWTEFDDLTVDAGLWHFLHWRSTASLCMDYKLTGDARQIAAFDAPVGSLWQQINSVTQSTILATPACDRFGRLFIEINSQFLPVADRASIPTVQAIATQDWHGDIQIERRILNECSMLDLSGIAYQDGSGTALFSISPGHVFSRYGRIEPKDRLALSSQSQANTLAGLIFGNLNNPYPRIYLSMASNYRAVDICPHQYMTLNVATADTVRGITLSNLKIIPRSVRFAYDGNNGMLLTSIEAEGYTTADSSVNGDPPPSPPPPPAPPSPPPPPPVPEVPLLDVVIVMTESQLGLSIDFFTASSPHWADVSSGLTGTFYNFAMGSSGQGYAVTYDAGNLAGTGLWYCSDLFVASPTWSLIYSQQDARDDSGYNSEFYSLAIMDDDSVYISMQNGAYPTESTGYFKITGVSVGSFVDLSGGAIVGSISYSMATASSGSSALISGSGNYNAAGQVQKAPEDTSSKFTNGVNNTRGTWAVSANYCIGASTWGGNGDIYQHTDDINDLVYSGAWTKRPLTEGYGSLIWFNDDSDIVRDDVILADADLIFGIGFVGGACAMTEDADHIIWVCNDASPTNRIVYTDDAFVTNSPRDGDWEITIGTYAGGDDYAPCMVKWYEVEEF